MSEPSSSGKGKSKKMKENPKDYPKAKGAKGSSKGKTSEMRQVDNDETSVIHEEWSRVE